MHKKNRLGLNRSCHLLCCFLAVFVLACTALKTTALADEAQQEAIQAQIDALTEQKNGIDGIISELSAKPAELRAVQRTLSENYKKLAALKMRLKGIQLWNGFVGFIGAAFDCMQKVNPGSSIVVATATFIQDRAAATLPNPPLQAKMGRLSEDMKGLGSSLRMLDRALNLNAAEVADLLVAGQIQGATKVDIDSVAIRWNLEARARATPEELAKTGAVVTGKISLIMQEIDPAMKQLNGMKSSMDASIAEMSIYLDTAKAKSRDLSRQIANLKGKIEIEKIIEEAYEPVLIKDEYEVSMQDVPPKSPSMAFAEVQSAWNDLLANAITGETYEAVKRRMDSAIWKHYGQQIEPTRKEMLRTNDYLFHVVPGIVKNIKDRYVRIATFEAAQRAAAAAWENNDRVSKELLKEQKGSYRKPMEEQRKTEAGEMPRFHEFCNRMKALVDIPFSGTFLSEGEVREWESQPEIISSGEYWAHNAWGQLPRWFYFLRGDPEAVQKAEKLMSGAEKTAAQMRGKLEQAEAMASELETNLQLWRYMNSRMASNCRHFGRYDAWLPHLKVGPKMFDLHANILRQEAERDFEFLKEETQRAKRSAAILALRPNLIEEARETVDSWSKAQSMSVGNALNQEGSSAKQFFQTNNVNRERTEELRKTVLKLQTNPKEIENYVLKEVTSAGPLAPSTEKLRTLQQEYAQQKSAIAERRTAYVRHQDKYQQLFSELEEKLFDLQSQLTAALPRVAASFSVEAIMAEAGQKEPISGWVLPDPADLPQPDPADDSLMHDYTMLAIQYNHLLAPYREKAKKRYDTARGAMLVIARKPLTREILQPEISPEEFEGRIASITSEAKTVYEPLAFLDSGENKTDLGASYQVFLDAVGQAREQYLNFWRIRVFNRLDEVRDELGKGALSDQGKVDEFRKELSLLLAPESFADRMRQHRLVADLVVAIQEVLDLLNKGPDPLEAVADFYNAFKQAYEGRNESLVMSFISDDWTAPGGVTLFDLEENLRNMFSVFDEVEYQLSGLSVQPAEAGRYKTSYQVSIKGRNFDNDLLHEESSEVSEIVEIGPDKKLKIVQTQGGSYW